MRLTAITLFAASLVAAGLAVITDRSEAQTSEMLLHSPRNYQVFQRETRLRGAILVSGRALTACDKVEARITGTSLNGPLPDRWHALALERETRSFYGLVPTTAGGWYQVEVRARKSGRTVAQATVEKVGVGEVFVGAGQSNSTNSGEQRITQTSGMVSSFSGSDWRLADDPQPGTHDRSGGGSFWPAFGDALYEKYRVPIGVAVTGHGGTSVKQWQPGGELFQWMMGRIHQLGPRGFRALLWHQGETDVGMPPEEYAALLKNVILASKREAGWEFPWFVAQVSYHNPQRPSFPTTRAAQKQLWETGVAMEGPDTDTLGGDHRDMNGLGIHFSPKGLRAHGKMWAEKVSVYLDKMLGR